MPRRLVLALANGQSSRTFEQQYLQGYRADRTPYGLENLPEGWEYGFIEGEPGSDKRSKVSRLVARALQFDGVNAVKRRRAWSTAAVVYGHTEREYLAVAFARRLLRVRGPMIVGQTVWLLAQYEGLSRVRRAILRWSFSGVDLFVHNARPNYELARRILPHKRHEYVPFGISPDYYDPSPRPEGRARPLIVTVGGDRARDWDTLRSALRPLAAVADIRVASDSKLTGFDFADVGRTRSIAELKQLHRECAVMVIAAKGNAHASGITAILEAAASGTPVVATRTGGLDAYFADDEVAFAPEGDGEALERAMREFLDDPAKAARFGERLRERWIRSDYSSRGYWDRVTAAAAG